MSIFRTLAWSRSELHIATVPVSLSIAGSRVNFSLQKICDYFEQDIHLMRCSIFRRELGCPTGSRSRVLGLQGRVVPGACACSNQIGLGSFLSLICIIDREWHETGNSG